MGEAADRYAAISRAQWENYKSFGFPIENSLLDMIGNKDLLNSELNSATQTATEAGQTAASESARTMAAYGIKQSADQSASSTRLNNLQTAANTANARDLVRENAKERDMNILIGTAPNDGLADV